MTLKEINKRSVMNQKLSTLANAELGVMEILWEELSVTARRIRERLYPDTSHAQHGTVQRLLQRLEEKGFVQRHTEGSVLTFTALISKSEYASSQLESLADKLTGGSLAPLITHFVEEKKISKDEIRRLRSLLDNLTEE